MLLSDQLRNVTTGNDGRLLGKALDQGRSQGGGVVILPPPLKGIAWRSPTPSTTPLFGPILTPLPPCEKTGYDLALDPYTVRGVQQPLKLIEMRTG
jgi:hypothetical protein